MNEQPTTPAAAPAPSAKLTSPLVLGPAALALAGLLYLGLRDLVTTLTHEATDDAFIAARIVSVSPRIAGAVAAVPVNDNQLVRSNELLVEIDPADYSLVVAQKEGAAEAQQASYQTMLAGWQLTQVKVTTAEATAL